MNEVLVLYTLDPNCVVNMTGCHTHQSDNVPLLVYIWHGVTMCFHAFYGVNGTSVMCVKQPQSLLHHDAAIL